MQGVVLTLTAPSCAGKSFLERELQRHHGFGRAISHTTRARRATERGGVDYHFTDLEGFRELYVAGAFMETVQFGETMYGMAESSVRAAMDASPSGNVVIVVEPVGAGQILKHCRAHDLPTVAAWIDVDGMTQAERYFERLRNDLRFALTPEGEQAIYRDASKRMSLMLTTEAEWRYHAQVGRIGNSTERYDLLFQESTPATLPDIIHSIKERVAHKGRVEA